MQQSNCSESVWNRFGIGEFVAASPLNNDQEFAAAASASVPMLLKFLKHLETKILFENRENEKFGKIKFTKIKKSLFFPSF